MPLSTIRPSLLSEAPISCFVVTPLAALAKLDMAVADKGGIPSIAGGGTISNDFPLAEGNGFSVEGIDISTFTLWSGLLPGMSSGVVAERLVFPSVPSEPDEEALPYVSSCSRSDKLLTLIVCSVLVRPLRPPFRSPLRPAGIS